MYLNKEQVLMFIEKITLLKCKYPYFNDKICEEFIQYVIKQTATINSTHPIKLKLIPSTNSYVVSESLFNYLKTLTGVDPLDYEQLQSYVQPLENIPKIK